MIYVSIFLAIIYVLIISPANIVLAFLIDAGIAELSGTFTLSWTVLALVSNLVLVIWTEPYPNEKNISKNKQPTDSHCQSVTICRLFLFAY